MFEIRFSIFSIKEASVDRILEIHKGLPKGIGVEESNGVVSFSILLQPNPTETAGSFLQE